MAAGPLERYSAAAQRVESLQAARDQLRAEVDRLEQRRERLNDPDHLELVARSQLGMVKPGEIPFVVVPRDGDDDGQPAEVAGDEATEPWYRRIWNGLAEWLRRVG